VLNLTTAPPDPLAGFKGSYFWEGRERGGKGEKREGKGEGGEAKGRRGGEEKEGMVPPTATHPPLIARNYIILATFLVQKVLV